MTFYRCIYFRNNVPDGKAYTFRSEEEFKHGDTVNVFGGKKAMVAGILTEEEVEFDLLAIKPIIGIWKDDKDDE